MLKLLIHPDAEKNFVERLKAHAADFEKVVPFESGDRLLQLDFTENNKELNPEILNDTDRFIRYINKKLADSGALYGIGGYGEHRTIYNQSKVFDDPDGGEPRRLHLGIDIWGRPYTKVMAPINGIVHSFGFKNDFGDYGTVVILIHQMAGFHFIRSMDI